MAFVPSKLQETFRIQCPGAETNEELAEVYFEISGIYEKRVKNNKGISKFLEDQWLKSCIGWEKVVDDNGRHIECTEETKREWFRNPALQPLIEELLNELENRSRDQLGIQEKN